MGGDLNWKQIIREDTHPPLGKKAPYLDGHAPPFYWDEGNGPNGILSNRFEIQLSE